MAAVYHISAFVDGLINMASIAEVGRAQPALVTQLKKADVQGGVAPADMFFDSESRGISRDQAEDDNAHNARALQLQLQLCAILNQAGMGGTRAQIGAGTGAAGSSSDAGGVATRLFTLPADQEVAPNAPVPQTRADLESLLRLSVDFMCTAIGTPPPDFPTARHRSAARHRPLPPFRSQACRARSSSKAATPAAPRPSTPRLPLKPPPRAHAAPTHDA